ncbi:DUF4386 domain-containing protein [Agromyces soli]|uniref:DUF4386 domain-containing protein n=1 Tax=Agromyces soli TaxID=659012 RepID=A0ABY4AQY9_9MICO|nr:DUF4386 domain-containing protein [Agromyces soli]UOE25554.1 DUF4386 domain-containing protein [Agromyces soli]
MNQQRTARLTGVAYLGLAVFGMAGFLVIRPQLRAPGDPVGTLGLLREQAWLAHLGIALELLVVIAQAAAAVGFFALFQRDRPGAAFATAAFGMANATAILTSAALLMAASNVAADPALAPGGDAAATATLLLLTIADACWAVGAVFFGLWLLPMGWFARSTDRMPSLLGWTLLAGGTGYVLSSLVGAALPDVPALVLDALTIPATIAEFWVIGYLLVVGIRPPARIGGASVAPVLAGR